MRLIGLTGPKGSGKSTVAEILNAHGFETYALADPIKRGLKAMFNLWSPHVDGGRKETPIEHLGGLTPRYLMQTLGTEWGRNTVATDIWIRMAKRKFEFFSHIRVDAVVVPDVRFDNEANWIREEGGVIWHIYRDASGAGDTHESEAGVTVKPGDAAIQNNGSIEHLEETVAELVG